MTEELKKTTEEEIARLPKEIGEAVNNSNWVKITEEIGKKYSFSEKEITNLQAETAIILVGAEDSDLFAENIENNVRTTKEKAEKISAEIFEKIFIPINGIIEGKIKNNMQGKEMNWQQSINFILSGGNYSVLLENPTHKVSTEPQKVSSVLGAKSMQDIKDKLVN